MNDSCVRTMKKYLEKLAYLLIFQSLFSCSFLVKKRQLKEVFQNYFSQITVC
jgi:hypothetical protein